MYMYHIYLNIYVLLCVCCLWSDASSKFKIRTGYYTI